MARAGMAHLLLSIPQAAGCVLVSSRRGHAYAIHSRARHGRQTLSHARAAPKMLQPALSWPRYRGPRQVLRQSYGSRGKARSEVVKVAQRWPRWVRRLTFTAVLILAAATPGMAATLSSSRCQHSGCEKAGTVRWIQPLPGSWTVQNGITGTAPATGQAYGALGAQLAAIGSGLTVSAYRASTGQRLWTTRLTGFAPGSAITAVRVWPGVVTVGVTPPAPGAPPATATTPTTATTPARGATTPAPGATTPAPGATT